MSYLLTMQDAQGVLSKLFYDPHTSELRDEDGASVFSGQPDKTWPEVHRVSPEQPGSKSNAPATLKIQLGLKCNYSCSYCLQSSGIEDASVSSLADTHEFLNNLDSWLHGAPQKIQFWGGEPFVYWAHLKQLVPVLREKFPEASFSVLTNGSLIDLEKIAFIEKYDITVRISHDAMAQDMRGPDPFDQPGQTEIFKELWRVRGDKFGFNSVITSRNSDVSAIAAWFEKKMGGPVSVSFEGVVHSYDMQTRDNQADWSAEQYNQMQHHVIKALINGSDIGKNSVLGTKAQLFLSSLKEKRPSSSLGQKCNMDRPDQLAVDLKGNVTTCQNVGAAGKHGIGHVNELAAVALDTSWHWSHRENCSHCPMLQLCKGACMYNEGDDFTLSCENEFHFNWAIMTGALYWATGKLMVGIEGDIRRPVRRKIIPLTAIAA